MDSANKQDAIVAEVTKGTTPSSPAFKTLRTSAITGAPVRNSTRSPERRADRRAASMVTGLSVFEKTIEMPFARDEGTDILLASLFNNTWATNVLKDGSTPSAFTLEEKYEGGSTDFYRRLTGCQVNTLTMAFRLGEAGTMSFGLLARGESTGTTALGSSTYAAPTPGYDPVSSVAITGADVFGLTTPRVTALNMTITNNEAGLYAFGSDSPFDLGLGLFDVSGTVELYLSAATDYTSFIPRLADSFSFVFGSVSNYKDQIDMGAVDIFNPQISDPGPTGQHMVTLPFMAKYYASDTAAIKWTRLVA